MRVRLIFRCPHCGSRSFRPSTLRKTQDSVLRSLGLHPQRCYMCRSRFYSFRLANFRSLLAVLDGSRSDRVQTARTDVAAASGESPNVVRWKATRNKRF